MNEFNLDNTNILVIGDAFVDLSTHISRMPPPGGSVWGTAIQMCAGGASANVSVNLSKLGIPSTFLGCLGEDFYGEYLYESFNSANVDTSIILKKDAYTGAVFVAVDETGERTFFPCALKAAHAQLSVDDIKKINFSSFDALFTCGVSLAEQPSCDAIIYALTLAKKIGIPTFYDPNLRLEGDMFTEEYKSAQWRAIEQSNVVLIGDDECKILCDVMDIGEGAKYILRKGPEIVIVKRGSQGATAFDKHRKNSSKGISVEVIDTTGAGDAFDAGFIAAYIRGLDIDDALIYGNVVAGLKVARQGTRNIPSHEEVQDFLANN